MTSLFQTLFEKRRDYHLENYFTEIVAAVFRRNPEILYGWLKKIGAIQESPQYDASPEVITQRQYDKKDQPDILINIREPSARTVIVVESKTSYRKGLHDYQLERYAKMLHGKYGDAQKRCLVFVSHTFERVNEKAILEGIPEGSVCFYHTNWNDFYHLLTSFRQDSLVSEISQFMEELGMAYDDRFTKDNLLALDTLPKLFKLMEHCLSGEVLEEFKTLTGKQAVHPKYYEGEGRYILKHENETWRLQMGFFFGEDETGPRVGFEFYVKPSPSRSKYIFVLKDLLKLDQWEPYDWDGKDESSIKQDSDPCVFHSVELKAFQSDENNVAQIKEYFIHRMDEFASIMSMKDYQKLPW